METNTFTLLVTGSRSWEDYGAVARQLAIAFANAKEKGYQKVVIRHGACKTGADAMAHEFTNKVERSIDGLRLELDPVPAKWNKHGKAAGPIRNKEMVDLGADLCLAFIKGASAGAGGCARMAKEAGIETVYFRS